MATCVLQQTWIDFSPPRSAEPRLELRRSGPFGPDTPRRRTAPKYRDVEWPCHACEIQWLGDAHDGAGVGAVMKMLRRLLGGISSAAPVDRRKASTLKKRQVWRISEETPQGEWVDRDTAPAPLHAESRSGESSGGWAMSSMDLLDGADIVERPDAMPDDAVDELASFYCPPRRD